MLSCKNLLFQDSSKIVLVQKLFFLSRQFQRLQVQTDGFPHHNFTRFPVIEATFLIETCFGLSLKSTQNLPSPRFYSILKCKTTIQLGQVRSKELNRKCYYFLASEKQSWSIFKSEYFIWVWKYKFNSWSFIWHHHQFWYLFENRRSKLKTCFYKSFTY